MSPLRQEAIKALQASLGYEFSSQDLLEQALTHASFGQGRSKKEVDNDRLEYLGDRVLSLLVAEALMKNDEDADSGRLSKRAHSLVSRETCALIAKTLPLSQALRVSMQGGRQHDTILGNALESLLGAIYLDGGLVAARRVFEPLWQDHFEKATDEALLNPKSFVQEWAAAEQKPNPIYELLEKTGPEHAPEFSVVLMLQGMQPIIAKGRSRQEAEKAAAIQFIQSIRPKIINPK
jgi:ribonuclease-3